MYGPDVAILLTYGSHDMRHTGFHRLTVVNGNPGVQGATFFLYKISIINRKGFLYQSINYLFS